MTDTPTTAEAPATTEGAVSESLLTGATTPASEQTQAPPVPETPAADAVKAEGEGAETKTADAPAGAPEAYAEFTMPEGAAIAPEVLADLQTLAKDLNLPQEQAQKVADLGAKMAQKWAGDLAAAQATQQSEWLTAAQTDKEFGGDKLQDNIVVAKKALDAFGSPELKALLNETKLGNHPEMVRLLVRAGKAISEDKLVVGTNGTATAPRSLATTMYPTPASKG